MQRRLAPTAMEVSLEELIGDRWVSLRSALDESHAGTEGDNNGNQKAHITKKE